MEEFSELGAAWADLMAAAKKATLPCFEWILDRPVITYLLILVLLFFMTLVVWGWYNDPVRSILHLL